MIMLNVQQKVRQRKDKLQTCHPQLTSVLHYVGVNAAVGARPNPSDHSTVHHHYHQLPQSFPLQTGRRHPFHVFELDFFTI